MEQKKLFDKEFTSTKVWSMIVTYNYDITDLRASLALGTVKKRIRMCGRPAVPNISAMPNEIAEIGSLTKLPGPIINCPPPRLPPTSGLRLWPGWL